MSQFIEDKFDVENLQEVQENANLKDNEERILKFPYEVKFVENETNQELMKYFTGERTGFVQVGPKKWFFPSRYLEEAEHFYNFKARPDDVFVITFPRSGTTWAQEMVWMLCNDLDYQKSAEIPLLYRFPFLEVNIFFHKDAKKEFLQENEHDPEKYRVVQTIDTPVWQVLGKMKERRFIKTHLPFSLLPPTLLNVGCKVIYVARNPKDVAVSYYHLSRSFRTLGYNGDFPRYYDYFERNLQPWAPYWEHVKEGWERRHENNVLFMFYEDMNKNLRKQIEKVAHFLRKSYTNQELDNLEEHLKIENFRDNKSINFNVFDELGVIRGGEAGFVRKGKTGGWREYFDNEMERRVDAWIQENMNDTDIVFPL